jgi:hypothetical protein
MVLTLAASPWLPAEPIDPPSPSGVWACQSIAAGSFTGRPCRLEPWLTLNADGRYRWGRDEGEWQWKDGRLTLSGRSGSGQLDSDGKFIFEYQRNGETYRLTLYRRS